MIFPGNLRGPSCTCVRHAAWFTWLTLVVFFLASFPCLVSMLLEADVQGVHSKKLVFVMYCGFCVYQLILDVTLAGAGEEVLQ